MVFKSESSKWLDINPKVAYYAGVMVEIGQVSLDDYGRNLCIRLPTVQPDMSAWLADFCNYFEIPSTEVIPIKWSQMKSIEFTFDGINDFLERWGFWLAGPIPLSDTTKPYINHYLVGILDGNHILFPDDRWDEYAIIEYFARAVRTNHLVHLLTTYLEVPRKVIEFTAHHDGYFLRIRVTTPLFFTRLILNGYLIPVGNSVETLPDPFRKLARLFDVSIP